MSGDRWDRFQSRMRTEWMYFVTIHPSERRWQMPFCAALAVGLPLLIGAYFDRMDYGLASSLGGLVFLYTSDQPMYHRVVSLMAAAFGMSACYTLGLLAHFLPILLVPIMTFLAILVSMVCRFYRVGAPGSLFFIMTASIGAYSPVEVMQLPLFVGLLTMGGLLAVLIAFCYSLYIVRVRAPQPVMPLTSLNIDFVVIDSLIIGVFVGISLALAQALQLERAYWVPVSCLAVIQGASLRAVWTRKMHRVVGTAVGLALAWGLLALPLDKWGMCLLMMLLTFIIETLVVRHYGLAAVFITPLTIFLAEATQVGAFSPMTILEARLVDTVLGAAVGLLGGVCLHSPAVRLMVARYIGRLPGRLFN